MRAHECVCVCAFFMLLSLVVCRSRKGSMSVDVVLSVTFACIIRMVYGAVRRPPDEVEQVKNSNLAHGGTQIILYTRTHAQYLMRGGISTHGLS